MSASGILVDRAGRGFPAVWPCRSRLGLVVGVAFAAVATWVFARLPHSIGAFAPVASVATASLAFGAADVMGGSGFLAVYLVGLAIGSTPSCYRREIVTFHQGLALLAQVTLFVVLGLLVFPHDLGGVAADDSPSPCCSSP